MPNYEDIFRQSYIRALGNDSYRDDFIGQFYTLFISKSPKIGRLFANTNMGVQKTMLHDSLHLLLDFYSSKEITPYLRRLSTIHGKKGLNIPESFYELWIESLVEAVAQFDPKFNPEVELAWRLVLAPGIICIKYLDKLS